MVPGVTGDVVSWRLQRPVKVPLEPGSLSLGVCSVALGTVGLVDGAAPFDLPFIQGLHGFTCRTCQTGIAELSIEPPCEGTNEQQTHCDRTRSPKPFLAFHRSPDWNRSQKEESRIKTTVVVEACSGAHSVRRAVPVAESKTQPLGRDAAEFSPPTVMPTKTPPIPRA